MIEYSHFEELAEEERSDIEEILRIVVYDQFFKEKLSDNYFKFVVELQSDKFVTEMYADEVEKSARLTIEILEELKNINNTGLDRTKLEVLKKENDFNDGKIVHLMGLWNEVQTEHLGNLISELDRVRRIGGAYAEFIKNPCIISAILAVFERLVDSFDDEDLYLKCAYFLMRAVMKMNSSEYL